MAEVYEVSYAPSLSMMWRCATRQPSKGKRVLFGDPTENLPFIGAGTEAYRKKHLDVEVVHGREATVDKLLKKGREAERADIWAHMESKKIFLAANEELSLNQVYGELKLRCKPNVVLNGCSSGLMNPRVASDGRADLTDFDGLPMGFLFAGARTVVSTLWTVFDISAALMMDRYQKELEKEGATSAQALREATRWLREDIKNGRELYAVVEEFLDRVPRNWKAEHPEKVDFCWKEVAYYMKEHPDSPPFASPIHWASHFVTGWCWEPV